MYDPTRDKKIDKNNFKITSDELINVVLKDLNLSKDERSLLLIDKMFEDTESFSNLDFENYNKLYLYYGAFLGECLKEIFNGEWVFNDQSERWGVEVLLENGKDKMFLNPFLKISKILNKEEDAGAIGYWYKMVQNLIKNDGHIEPQK